jgi:hypothetical protein
MRRFDKYSAQVNISQPGGRHRAADTGADCAQRGRSVTPPLNPVLSDLVFPRYRQR